MDDWSQEFKNLLSSPLGKELLRTLREDVHDNLVTDAEKSDVIENAFGLLNQARGVIKSIEHLQFRSDTGNRAVLPKDEGSEKK